MSMKKVFTILGIAGVCYISGLILIPWLFYLMIFGAFSTFDPDTTSLTSRCLWCAADTVFCILYYALASPVLLLEYLDPIKSAWPFSGWHWYTGLAFGSLCWGVVIYYGVLFLRRRLRRRDQAYQSDEPNADTTPRRLS
jgi:hypothetical protein